MRVRIFSGFIFFRTLYTKATLVLKMQFQHFLYLVFTRDNTALWVCTIARFIKTPKHFLEILSAKDTNIDLRKRNLMAKVVFCWAYAKNLSCRAPHKPAVSRPRVTRRQQRCR